VISICYSLWLKNLAIIELGVVASGFFLRAYGGAVTSHITVSTWFLVVISFGALFLVVGKRTSEMKKVGVKATRPVLAEYTLEFCAPRSHSAPPWSLPVTAVGVRHVVDRPLFDLQRLRADSFDVVPVVFAVLFIMRSADAGDSAARKICSCTTARSRRSPSSGSRSWRGESTDESRHALRLGSYVAQRRHLDDVSSESEIAIALASSRAIIARASGAATVTPPR